MKYVITALVLLACVVLVVVKKKKPTEDKLEKQKREYEETLAINQVPENHYKIVVGQSKVYNIYNCPAIVWKEENMIKTLYLRANAKPILAQQEEEEDEDEDGDKDDKKDKNSSKKDHKALVAYIDDLKAIDDELK